MWSPLSLPILRSPRKGHTNRSPVSTASASTLRIGPRGRISRRTMHPLNRDKRWCTTYNLSSFAIAVSYLLSRARFERATPGFSGPRSTTELPTLNLMGRSVCPFRACRRFVRGNTSLQCEVQSRAYVCRIDGRSCMAQASVMCLRVFHLSSVRRRFSFPPLPVDCCVPFVGWQKHEVTRTGHRRCIYDPGGLSWVSCCHELNAQTSVLQLGNITSCFVCQGGLRARAAPISSQLTSLPPPTAAGRSRTGGNSSGLRFRSSDQLRFCT